MLQGPGAPGLQSSRHRPSPGQGGGRLVWQVATVRACPSRGACAGPGHGSQHQGGPLFCLPRVALAPFEGSGCPKQPLPSARAATAGESSALQWPPAFRAAGLHPACPLPSPGPRGLAEPASPAASPGPAGAPADPRPQCSARPPPAARPLPASLPRKETTSGKYSGYF